MPATPNSRAWPIIERDADVASLVDRLSRLPVRAQVITGPAGIGKTVLAQQVAERFGDRTVISVTALAELAGVPLGAFTPTLNWPKIHRASGRATGKGNRDSANDCGSEGLLRPSART